MGCAGGGAEGVARPVTPPSEVVGMSMASLTERLYQERLAKGESSTCSSFLNGESSCRRRDEYRS